MTPVPPLTRGDFRATHEYRSLPVLPSKAVTIELATEFWDRPIAGLGTYRGQTYWFGTYFDGALGDSPHPRPSVVARVSQAVIDAERHGHHRFLEEVWDVGLTPPVLRSEAAHERYSREQQARIRPSLDDAPLIGWTYLPDLKR